MIYKMELSDSVDTMVFDLLEVPIEGKDITGIADNTTIDGNVFRDYLWLKKQWTQRWSIMCQDEYERLRGFWTRQFGNAEVPLYRLFYGENRYEDRNAFTVNGFVQIENDAPLYSPLSLTNLYGNATQKTLSGKNLLNINATYDSYNATSTVSGQTITATVSNPAQTSTARVTIPFAYEQGRQMTISFDATLLADTVSESMTPVVCLRTVGAGDTTAIAELDMTLNTKKHYSLTTNALDNNTRSLWLYIKNINASGNVSFKFENIQIEYGTQETSYEPYCGGVPSPNPSYPQDVNVVSGAQEIVLSGKNLWSSEWEQGQINGSTGQNEPNNYTVRTAGYIRVEPNQHYAINRSIYTQFINVRCYDANKNYIGSGAVGIDFISGQGSSNASNPMAQGAYRCVISPKDGVYYLRFNDNSNDLSTEYMMVRGDTQADYEPYQSQSQEINLGKNLFDKDGYTESGWIDNTGGHVIDNTRCITDYIPIIGGTTYTTSGMSASGTNPARCYYDNAKNFISGAKHNNASPFTNTAPENAFYMRDCFFVADIDSIQIEAGPATSYAPYKTPIELAKIGTYQDYIYKSGDKWYKHAEIGKATFNGSEDWAVVYPGTDNFYYRLSGAVPDAKIATANSLISNYGSWGAVGDSNTNTGIYIVTAGGVRIRYGTEMALTNWENTLGATNMVLYYLLATPTDTEITDSELIEQLNHIYSLYGGQNNLWLIPSGGAQGEMGVKYRLNYEEETDIIPSTPVVLTLSDGGVINTCGCRQNIQLIMRETESD